MRTINVIEVENGLVKSCTSFPIEEEQLSEDVIEEAEDLLIKKAKENGLEDDGCISSGDVYDTIETGFYQNGNYSVNLVWSA